MPMDGARGESFGFAGDELLDVVLEAFCAFSRRGLIGGIGTFCIFCFDPSGD